MRVCILTRSDVFPDNHGAAVKIVQTITGVSQHLSSPTCLITDDRDHYWVFYQSEWQQRPYPARFRALQEWPVMRSLPMLARKICRQIGYPEEEHFLYTPQFDLSWVVRAVAVGLVEQIAVFQAEFPGYGLAAKLASEVMSLIGSRHPRTVIVQHNVEWDRLQAFGHQVSGIKRLECFALHAVDDVIAVSREDKELMTSAGVSANKITVIPHGVDCAAFQYRRGQRWRKLLGIAPDTTVLFFHGTLHYWPNTEAVRFIAAELLPLLRAQLDSFKVVVAGLSPPLYYSAPEILFTGPVDDLAGHIDMADVCICPLFAGGGTRLKLLEYLAAGKAVVSTKKGAEGIPDEGQFLLAESASEFCEAILRLLNSETLREQLTSTGKGFAARLDWSRVCERYVDLYYGLGRAEDWSRRLLTDVLPPSDHKPNIEAYLPSRTPSKPRTLLLLVNRGCNLRCTFCDLWEDHIQMPKEQVLELLEDAVSIGTKILVLTGGEPMLHPDIFEIIGSAKALGMTVNMTTNGTLVEKHWDALLGSGIDSLSFSLDGIGVVHDELRGQEGAYKRTLNGLERVVAETTISCSVYFVATNKNVHQLLEVYQLSQNLQVGFDFWPVNEAPELYIKSPEHQQQWRHAVNVISKEQPAVSARSAFYRDALTYHQSVAGVRSAVRCLGLVDQYGVNYDGDLLPCCVWEGEGLKVGNILETPLRELWYSSEVQEYRRSLVEEGCSAGCFNHSLYEFTESTATPFVISAPSV